MLIQRLEHVQIENLVRSFAGIPEPKQLYLRIEAVEFRRLPGHGRHAQRRIGTFAGRGDTVLQREQLLPAGSLGLESLDVLGIGIDGLERIAHGTEDKSVVDSPEGVSRTLDILVEDRDYCKRLGIGQHEPGAVPVVTYILLVDFGLGRAGSGQRIQPGNIGAEGVIPLLEKDRTFGAGDLVIAESICAHHRLLSLLDKKGSNALVPLEDIDEFGLPRFDFHIVAEMPGGIRLDRIKDIGHCTFQLFQHETGRRGVGDGEVDGSLVCSAGCSKQRCAQQ